MFTIKIGRLGLWKYFTEGKFYVLLILVRRKLNFVDGGLDALPPPSAKIQRQYTDEENMINVGTKRKDMNSELDNPTPQKINKKEDIRNYIRKLKPEQPPNSEGVVEGNQKLVENRSYQQQITETKEQKQQETKLIQVTTKSIPMTDPSRT